MFVNRYNIAFILHNNNDKKDIFLYGISIPTTYNYKIDESFNFKDKDSFIENKNILKKYNKTLVVYKKLTNDYCIDQAINLTKIFGKNIKNENNEDLSFNVLNKQDIIQVYNDYKNYSPESIFKLPINTEVYYTDSFLKYYNSQKNFNEIIEILKFLKENISLSFIDNNDNLYSKRIGCFEYITKVPEFIEYRDKIFEISTEFIDDSKSQERVYFCKLQKYNKPLSITLTLYNDLNDIIFCQKKDIKPRENKIYFDKIFQTEYVGYIKYQIFDQDGNLISDYKCAFLKSIIITIGTYGNDASYKISDSNYKKNSIFRNTNQTIQNSNVHKSNLYINHDSKLNNNWKNVYEYTRNFYHELIDYMDNNKKFYDVFIDNNDTEKVEKIKKFFYNITKDNNYLMTIIDPYFGVDFNNNQITSNSFEIFYSLPKNIKLKIISCLNIIKNNNIDKIRQIIKNFKDYNLSLGNTIWYDFTEQKKFHDRYIKIENKDINKVHLYMVSNSFNSLLENFPFCIVEVLNENAKANILSYIDKLEQDNTKNNILEENNKNA